MACNCTKGKNYVKITHTQVYALSSFACYIPEYFQAVHWAIDVYRLSFDHEEVCLEVNLKQFYETYFIVFATVHTKRYKYK